MTRLTLLLSLIPFLLTGCPEEESAPSTPPPTEPAPEEPTAEAPAPAEEPAEEETAEPTAEREDQSELECENEDVSCPLHDWQIEHAEPAVQDRDTDKLAAVLHQIEFYAPEESWNEGENGWARIARRGAIAAEAGDFDEARKACRNCHREYPNEEMPFRDMYRQQGYRTAELPELPENAAETGIPDLEMNEG